MSALAKDSVGHCVCLAPVVAVGRDLAVDELAHGRAQSAVTVVEVGAVPLLVPVFVVFK